MRTRRGMALLLVPVALALGACGGDDDAATTDTTAAAGTEAREVVFTAVEPEAGKYAFEVEDGLEDGFEGGLVELRLGNKGKEPHELNLFKWDEGDGRTAESVIDIINDDEGPLPAWAHGFGGVQATPPGTTASATVNLPAGSYVWFCQVADEEDVSHAKNGMIDTGEVTEGEQGSLPEADATIIATEYSFAATGLKAGTNTFEFRNDGLQQHHVFAAPIAPGKTIDDVKAFAANENPTGPPPVDFEKAVGAAPLDKGGRLVTTIKLSPGTYALLCFLPDIGTAGPPHVAKGMVVELEVT